MASAELIFVHGGLRKTHLFSNRMRIGRSGSFKVVDFGTIRKGVCLYWGSGLGPGGGAPAGVQGRESPVGVRGEADEVFVFKTFLNASVIVLHEMT